MITVTLQKNQVGAEEEVQIPHLHILSVDEMWDYVKRGDRTQLVYLGTLIGCHRHNGWLVKERKDTVEKLITKVANRCYNYQCGESCCGKDRLFKPAKRAPKGAA